LGKSVILCRGDAFLLCRPMITKIETHDQYIDVMNVIEIYLLKTTHQGGFEAFDKHDADELKRLSIMAEAYEDDIPLMPIRKPRSIMEVLRIKIMQMNLKQKEMAHLLDISESKLSDLMAGKRRIDIDMAKKLHQILKIEAEFILQAA
jgi:HTH-type transcriptional regulator / antitoxin HigA